MTDVAVTNSTCLIVLERVGRPDLLRSTFARIVIPAEVQDEFGAPVEWLDVRPVVNTNLLAALAAGLGRGEAAAIALALETEGAVVVLDDRRARRVAQGLGVPVMGTIGVLLRAKRLGHLSHVRPLLDEFAVAGFHISRALRTQALRLAGEDS